MGILDEYRAQVLEDKKNEDNSFPEGSMLNETQRSDYEKELEKLRNNPIDMEAVYQKKKMEMKQMSEKEMTEKELIKDEEVEKIFVKRAFCEECGEELISKTPPMFNPFTLESICKHTCEKCGKQYNLEHAYPRIVFLDNKGEEIPAFTR